MFIRRFQTQSDIKSLYRTFDNSSNQRLSLSALPKNDKPQLANLYKTSRLAKFNYRNSKDYKTDNTLSSRTKRFRIKIKANLDNKSPPRVRKSISTHNKSKSWKSPFKERDQRKSRNSPSETTIQPLVASKIIASIP